MREPWRFTYTYPNSELQEYLTEIRSGTFVGTNLLRREILLQSHENGLIRLPDNFIPGDVHMIPMTDIVFIEQPVQQQRH